MKYKKGTIQKEVYMMDLAPSDKETIIIYADIFDKNRNFKGLPSPKKEVTEVLSQYGLFYQYTW